MNIKKMQETLEKSPYCQRLIKEGAAASDEILKKIDAGECTCTETYQCLPCATRMQFVFTYPDPELEAIATAATEQSILATAARIERWRVAYEDDDAFAERPCDGCNGTGSVLDSCPDETPGCCVAHFRTHRKCNGRGWVRIGVARQPTIVTGTFEGATTGATPTVTNTKG